jgi:Tol biopolymer transport system component
MRPDGSAERVLYDQRTPMPDNRRPNSLRWANGNTLEWNRREEYIDQNGVTRFGEVLRRDVLNVFPDPNPVPLENHTINGMRIEELSVQPAGEWAIAVTSYNTGLGIDYRYYLYNLRSGEYRLFARNPDIYESPFWHPQGDRLFWTRSISTSRTDYFQMAAPDWTPQFLGQNMPISGTWSPDGRQIASTASNNAGQRYLIVWNVAEGFYNTYYIPETDTRSSLNNLMWSPDSRYLAFQTSLPRDRDQNVGAHTLVVQLSTGEVVDLTTGALPMVAWVREPGTYDEERRVTPTPTATYTPSPTPTP